MHTTLLGTQGKANNNSEAKKYIKVIKNSKVFHSNLFSTVHFRCINSALKTDVSQKLTLLTVMTYSLPVILPCCEDLKEYWAHQECLHFQTMML